VTPEFFLGLQDIEDEDEAALQAARSASNAITAKALAQKGVQ